MIDCVTGKYISCRIVECSCERAPQYSRVHGCSAHGFLGPIDDSQLADDLRFAVKIGPDCDCHGDEQSFLRLVLSRLAFERPKTWRDDVAVATGGLAPLIRHAIEAEMWRMR